MTENEDNIEDIKIEVSDIVDIPKKKTTKKTAAKPKRKVLEEPIHSQEAIQEILMQDVVVFMKSGHSYYGPNLEFTREAPFQRMSSADAQSLISSMPVRFCLATKDQVREFYSLG